MTTKTTQFNICDYIEDILYELGLDYTTINNKYVSLPCPIHNGDNPCGMSIYLNTKDGRWMCHTHDCHSKYEKSIIGFIKACLKVQANKEFKSYSDLLRKIRSSSYVRSNTIQERGFSPSQIKEIAPIPRRLVLKSLKIPSQYYVDRGYSKEILIKYDVGDCITKGKPMLHRAVFPIYNDKEEMIGCIGRSKFDKCKKCELYHSSTYPCPTPQYAMRYSKWKNQAGFSPENHLFNYNNVKKEILKCKKIIVVESAGNVLRLEEAGVHISVGTFGVNFTLSQRKLIDKTGAETIIVIGDNDKAGELLNQKVKDLAFMYKVTRLIPPKSDIGEMTVKEIQGWKELLELINE